MNQATRGSRVVFVGNIPFELSEEQLIEVFKEVGPVASFRLLFDRDTGRPKGYGFCEFLDAETAASAVRNLNDYEIGGRQLRVDYAAMDDNQRAPHNANNNNNPNQNRHAMHNSGPPMQQAPPPNMPPPPSLQQQQQQPVMNKPLSSVDEISKVLASMNSQDLFTLMSQMKQMSFERPDFTREFLGSNPQAAYALFQAMVMMNIVDPNIITRIMSVSPVAPPSNGPIGVTPSPSIMQQQLPPQQMPPQPPQQQQQQQQSPIRPQAPPPSMMNPNLAQPTMASPPVHTDMQSQDETEQQKALLMQVLQLTDEQINALPPQHRDQIRQLKSQLTLQQ